MKRLGLLLARGPGHRKTLLRVVEQLDPLSSGFAQGLANIDFVVWDVQMAVLYFDQSKLDEPLHIVVNIAVVTLQLHCQLANAQSFMSGHVLQQGHAFSVIAPWSCR